MFEFVWNSACWRLASGCLSTCQTATSRSAWFQSLISPSPTWDRYDINKIMTKWDQNISNNNMRTCASMQKDVKRWIRMCNVRKPFNCWACCFKVLHSRCLKSGMKWNHRCHRCMPPHFDNISPPWLCQYNCYFCNTMRNTPKRQRHLSSQRKGGSWILGVSLWRYSSVWKPYGHATIPPDQWGGRNHRSNLHQCQVLSFHRSAQTSCRTNLSGRRSMSCLWSTHSFLKPILQHPVQQMLSPMLRPLSPWSGIPSAPFGQSRQSKSNRCRGKVNGKEWKHYGIQGLLVSLLALLAFDARVTMRFLTVLQFSHSTRSPSF